MNCTVETITDAAGNIVCTMEKQEGIIKAIRLADGFRFKSVSYVDGKPHSGLECGSQGWGEFVSKGV